MWACSHTLTTTAPPAAVWTQYARGAWQQWDPGIEATRLDGPFVPGTIGYVKPKGGKEFRFRIIEATAPTLFTERTRMTGATFDLRHDIQEWGNGSKVTHTALLTGPLAHFYGATLGRRLKREMPDAMARMVALAERESSAPAPGARRPPRPATGVPPRQATAEV